MLLRVGESVRTRDCTAHVNERGQQQEMGSHVYVCVFVCVRLRERERVPKSESAPALLRGSVVFAICACLHCALFVFSAFS